MKICFSGGGTLGSVTPLLAIADVVRTHDTTTTFVWVGTSTGPEQQLVATQGIAFTSLSSGKFRRYISLWNVVDIARIAIGFFQSLVFLSREKPDVCVSAGGFVSVPLHYAAWVLGIPTWVHQQDIDVGLANRLMAPCARIITTALEKSVDHFSKKKTHWLGNPVRIDILSGDIVRARERFGITSQLPVVFATGGGTGSMRVNQLITEAVQHLDGVCEIIHLSGLERPQDLVERTARLFPYYHAYQFFTDEMRDAYALADLVISRAGFGTIAEIAALGKPTILIPKPGHQEDNVRYLAEQKAVVEVNEITSDGVYLAGKIKEVLQDQALQQDMSSNIKKILPVADSNAIISLVQSCVRRI